MNSTLKKNIRQPCTEDNCKHVAMFMLGLKLSSTVSGKENRAKIINIICEIPQYCSKIKNGKKFYRVFQRKCNELNEDMLKYLNVDMIEKFWIPFDKNNLVKQTRSGHFY